MSRYDLVPMYRKVTEAEARNYVVEQFSEEIKIDLVLPRRDYIEVQFSFPETPDYKGCFAVWRDENDEVYGEW